MTPTLLAIAAVAVPFALIATVRVGVTLTTRFDGHVLNPPSPDVPVHEIAGGQAAARARAELRQWCFDGAGPGHAPIWAPWSAPRVDQRFSVAVFTGHAPTLHALAQDFACELDGTRLLQACGTSAQRLALRLRVKMHDCLWWRRRDERDPWDAGTLRTTPDLPQHLARFRPRRATLIVAEASSADHLKHCISVLDSHRAEFRHPVRLLVLGEGGAEVALPGVKRISLEG